jgi:hypothetical protein
MYKINLGSILLVTALFGLLVVGYLSTSENGPVQGLEQIKVERTNSIEARLREAGA